MKVPASNFRIPSDYREEPEDIGDLALSIHQNILIQPIIVEKHGEFYHIAAGRRRFTALTEYLGLTELEENTHFLIREGMDVLLIQLEENFKRKNYKPIEIARLVTDIHKRQVKEHGAAVKGRRGGWGLKDTAKMVSRDKGFVSKMLAIVTNAELVESCETLADAFDKISQEKSRKLAKKIRKARTKKVLENLDEELESYINNFHFVKAENFLPGVEDASVDLILTDPPFGIGLDKMASGVDYDVYSDKPEAIASTIEFCIPHLYRVLREDKYVIIWTGYHYLNELQRLMAKADFTVASTPLHWIKTDSPGKSMNPSLTCGNMLQVAVYGWKGGNAELTIKGRGNGFPYPIVRSDRIHVAQMPETLLLDLLSIFSNEGDTVLDVFAGSGSVLRSCFMSRRGFVGCEKDEDAYNRAVNYTQEWARKRQNDTD